jgi:type IV pilus assembly protein PilM
MIIAARRDEIGKFMGLLKRAGLVVEAVDFRLASLVRLHRLLASVPEEPILLCNLGETESMLATVTNQSVLAQHYVSWGTRVLLDKVRAGFGLKDESRKAEALLRRYGLLYEDRDAWKQEVDASKEATAESASRAIYQIVSPHIEELVYELHKLISYVRSEAHNVSFEGIYLYGEAAVIRHLDRCLERRLSIPTQVMEPMSRMNLSDESILPDRSRGRPFGPALGLAMRRVTWL